MGITQKALNKLAGHVMTIPTDAQGRHFNRRLANLALATFIIVEAIRTVVMLLTYNGC